MDIKPTLKRFWKFIWEDDSFLSWIVNVVLAFLIVKFLLYPALGLLLGTSYPVVAVVSGSMEHNSQNFDTWWENKKIEYAEFNLQKEQFNNYKLKNGFNKGDLIVLKGPKNIQKGDIIVFWGQAGAPIIHRVVEIRESNDRFYYQTKGDNNPGSRDDELTITQDRILGKASFKIPYFGWFKLTFVNLFDYITRR